MLSNPRHHYRHVVVLCEPKRERLHVRVDAVDDLLRRSFAMTSHRSDRARFVDVFFTASAASAAQRHQETIGEKLCCRWRGCLLREGCRLRVVRG